jgi:hypothetical protein
MATRKSTSKRTAHSTERRAARRAPYDKVLIVCEGAKTEPTYFKDLIKWHDISSVNVRVSGDCGSAPTSVVQHALELAKDEGKYGEPFDRVYCVFDRDSYHLETQNKVYQTALAQMEAMQDGYAINSVPSFEYWLLLHFCDSRQQFAAQGKKSVGEMVVKALKAFWPTYEKGAPQPYHFLKKTVPDGEAAALVRAKQALKQAHAVQDENPSTKVHELVEYLIHIKD